VTMKEKNTIVFMNTGISLALVLLIVMTVRSLGFFSKKETVKSVPAFVQPPEPAFKPLGIKHGEPVVSESVPKSLSEVYENFSRTDAGENPMAAWSKVSDADKAKLTGVLDKTIENSKTILANDPGNKKAKKLLFISESLKKLVSKNFEHKLEAQIKSQGPVPEKR